MKLVATSEDVNIYCPEGGRFSFFNSPYLAHRTCVGIDVYPRSVFGDVAPSPVRGEVVGIRRVKGSQTKSFEVSSHDYAILLSSSENPERWIKILHIEPLVKIGDAVEPGEDLGTLLRSGFFNFWTDPHIHVEIREPSDPLRARGGFKLERLMELDDTEAAKDLSGIVVESKPEYSLIALNDKFKQGIPAEMEGQIGILDAGIPHYRWFGVHIDTAPPLGGAVRLCGRKIGLVKSVYSNTCLAECSNLLFRANNKPVGLSLYLYPFSNPLVKIIPRKLGELTLEKFEEVCITLS